MGLIFELSEKGRKGYGLPKLDVPAVDRDPYPNSPKMHEVVFSMQKTGISSLDLAKALLDRGFYAPTVYFPLVVKDAVMIEPTETESPRTIRAFANAIKEIL